MNLLQFSRRILGLLAMLLMVFGGVAQAYSVVCTKVYASAFSAGRTKLYELNGSIMTSVFTAPQIVGGLAISANGSAYYDDGTFATPPLYRYNGTVQTNTTETVPGLLVGEAADAAGNVYYLDSVYHLRRATAGGTGVAIDLGALVFDFGDTIGPSLQYGDMTFDGNGRLHWYSSVAGTGLSYLYVIDTVTLKAKNVGNIGPNGATGLAFDATGKMITTVASGATIVSIDLASSNLAGTTIGTANPTVYDLGSCATPMLNAALNVVKTAANITKATNPATLANPGDTIEYTITTTNSGNFPSTDALLTDGIPAGATYVAGSTTLNGTAVADVSGVMPYVAGKEIYTASQPSGVIIVGAAKAAVVKFRVTVNANGAPASVDNTASLTYPTVNGGVTTSNPVSSTAKTPVSPRLTLNKTIAAPGRLNTADQFTVQIKNGATVTAFASTSNPGTTAATAATTLASGTSYTLTEIMAAGSVSALTSYTTAVACTNTTAGSTTILPSGAGVSFTLTPALGDVISCTLTNTPRQADLAINKTGPSVVTKNGTAIYTLTVWNRGPDSVSGGTITDSVPVNLTGVTFTCTASGAAVCGTASGSGNAISFSSGLLPINNTATAPVTGDYLTIKVTGTASTAGNITNTATVTSPASSLDGTATNNSSSQATIINNPPVTADVTNALLLDTAAATPLSPNLSATDPDGNATITTYTIVTLPTAASGVLSVNGAPITAANTSFTAAQLATLSFDPAAGFAGNATFTYTATDNQGAVSNTSTYTISVNAIPVAVSDTSTTPAGTAKTFSITGNDTDTAPGSINVASTVFATTGQPAGAVLTNGNRTITVPGEGSYTLDNAGNVTFTPVSGYSGTTTAVKYTVQDNQGATSNVANITVAVTPVATSDTASTAPSTLVNIPVLSNDVGTAKVLTSLLFPATGQPTGSVLSNGGKTLTNADGVYTIRPDGTVDFTPALGKTGTLSPVLYTYQDGAGQTSNPASITVSVSNIVPPVATNDSKTTPKSTAVTLEGSTNDAPGNLPIDNASVVLTAGGTITNAGKTLTNAQGVYQVQANGTVIFTPVGTFAGTTTPVSYTVKDTSGAVSNAATLSVTVTNQPPVASNVTNTLVTSTAPATALNPGVSGTDPDGTVVSYTVTTLPTAAMGTLYCSGTAIASVPVTCAPGTLTFKPNPAFNGNATFQYTVTDDNGAVSAAATYTIPVNKPPVAVDDSSSTNPVTSVTFSVTGNDTDTAPGTVDVTSAVFDPSSTGTISNAGKTLVVPGEGTYTLDNSGNVTFLPVAGFNNGTSTAKYTVKDNNGAVSNIATISVSVPASVNLAIAKAGPAYFKPGDTLTYTLTVTNSGSAATGVTVTDTLPTGFTFTSASGGGTYDAGTGKVSWTVGNVVSGATVTLTVTGTAPTAASTETNSGPISLVNTAVTAANEPELVTANNTASSTSQLVYPKLTKRVRNVTTGGAFGTTGTGKPGQVLEYCIDAKNYGVAVASFVIGDTVPTNTTVQLSAYGAGVGLQVIRGTTTTRTSTAGDADGGSLSATVLSADLGTLAAGESASVCFQASIK